MAKLARSQASGKIKSSLSSGAAGSSLARRSGYSSPVDNPRSVSTSSGKRAPSPSPGGSGKWYRGGRGVSPSPKSKRGFPEVGVISLSSLTGSLPLHWQAWRDRGADPWVVEVLQEGYRLTFLSVPPLSSEPIAMPSYSPNSIKGKALEEVTPSLVEKDAVELASLPSPGHYSLLFVVRKTSGSWRLVIDLSVLNCSVSKTPFKMETLASVLLSVRQGNWMVSLNLKEAYLQVPIHPDGRKFLRFVAFNRVHQFRALCFGLSTASQVFTRVMAPVSSILHSMGIRLRRYLDDWLIQASSREDVLHSLQTVLSLCLELGICSDRILTCRIKSIRSPAKVGLVVTDLITSPVVSWEGRETPPPPPPPAPRLCCHSLLNHRRGKTSLLLW